MTDLRVCFLGESFVAGAGDPEHLGWVGRVSARTERHGCSLTSYNLGIRSETSDGLLARWEQECCLRLPPTSQGRVVVSLGVNDTALEGAATRVARASTIANWRRLLDGVRAHGWPVLAVGPPPVADDGHNGRIAATDREYAAVCADLGVPYVTVVSTLQHDEVWRYEVRVGDGSHPAAAGYSRLADLVWPAWSSWLLLEPGPADDRPSVSAPGD